MQLKTQDTKVFPISFDDIRWKNLCQICEKIFAVSVQVLEHISQVHIMLNNDENQSANPIQDDEDIHFEDESRSGEELM